MKSQNKIVLSGLAIGFIAFSLAALLSAALLYGLTRLAARQSPGITEAWFWLGIFVLLGGAASSLLSGGGWTIIGRRLGTASLSPARQRRYSLVSGALLGLAAGLVCSLSSLPLVVVLSDKVSAGWLVGIAIVALPAGAGLLAGFLFGRLAPAQEATEKEAAPPAAPLRLVGLVAMPPLGALLSATFCAGDYYALMRGDLFLNMVFLGIPTILVVFMGLTLLALWYGLKVTAEAR